MDSGQPREVPVPAPQPIRYDYVPQDVADMRFDALRWLTVLRTKSRGMSGLLSSGVDLVPYQIQVATRILDDPLQRFLLADEVGMGKTIEAGIVIRQFLLDDPQCRVLVLVPAHLHIQWVGEFESRFGMSDYGSRLVILEHDRASTVQTQRFELLVIDEAHNVSLHRASPLTDAVRSLAASCRHLLLLSATPTLGDEEALLAMLALLQPGNTLGDDVEKLRERIARQEEYGAFLQGLHPNFPKVVLRQRISRAENVFPGDADVATLARRVGELLDQPSAERDAALRQLRFCIASRYRIHDRMIRTRRRDTDNAGFRRRGPQPGNDGSSEHQHIRTVSADLPDVREASLLLEQWRIEAVRVTDGQAPIDRYIRLFECLSLGLDEFASAAESMLAEESMFPGEDGILSDMVGLAPYAAEAMKHTMTACAGQLKALATSIGEGAKIVVFSSSDSVAERIADQLGGFTRGVLLLKCETGETPMQVARRLQIVRRFRDHPGLWLLVCGRHGEEGLNLHFAHGLCHLDVPLSPTRIEQRIGRLDRFGRDIDCLHQIAVLPTGEPNGPWSAWLRLLGEGFQIFNEPLSDVQFLLERLWARLRQEVFRHGAVGLLEMIPEVRSLVSQERTRQDNQYALDKAILTEAAAVTAVHDLSEIESKVDRFAPPLDRNLKRLDVMLGTAYGGPNRFCFSGSGIRRVNAMDPLLAERQHTWSRSVARTVPGCRILRPGHPVIDWLDERLNGESTAFATWRLVPDWGARIWIGFRVDMTSRALISGKVLRKAYLQRRADSILHPMLVRQYLTVNARIERDAEIRRLLKAPSGDCDIDLSQEPAVIEKSLGLDPSDLRSAFRKAAATARKWLSGGSDMTDRIAEACRRAVSDRDIRKRELRRHVTAWPPDTQMRFRLAQEILDEASVEDAVAKPDIRVRAIGLMVLAGEPPEDLR
jgi:ATP-dependent helicase HepA